MPSKLISAFFLLSVAMPSPAIAKPSAYYLDLSNKNKEKNLTPKFYLLESNDLNKEKHFYLIKPKKEVEKSAKRLQKERNNQEIKTRSLLSDL